MRYYHQLHADARTIFASLSDDDRKWPTTAGNWYLYLSMLDVRTLSLYGLTSEQVRDRSLG
jgi:hypothetical protein